MSNQLSGQRGKRMRWLGLAIVDGVCWEATYSAPAKKNTAGPPAQFKDKAD